MLIDGFLGDAVKLPSNVTMAITTIGQIAEIVTMVILGRVLVYLGWKWTMIIGILGHALRFCNFAFFGTEDWQWLIIAIQVLHGVCYAFFFATLYIYVDEVFPKDIRTSAQGLFNLLILGVGNVIASFWFISLKEQFRLEDKSVDYGNLFLIPTGLAVLATLMLVFFFKPPQARPQQLEKKRALSMSKVPLTQVWCDVGGTFTDCFVVSLTVQSIHQSIEQWYRQREAGPMGFP